MPGDAANLVIGEVQRIASQSNNTLGLASIGSLLFALWSANAGTKAIFDALNVAYGEKEKRGFIKLNLISLAFTMGALLFLLIAVAAVIVVPLILGNFGFLDWGEAILSALRWPILFLLIAGALALLYRYGPSRRPAKWRWLTVGSAVATCLFLVVSGLFSWYLANFANYNATYGSLGALIGLLMWLWVSIIVVLAGAELDAEIEHQTARDSTVGPAKPLGTRGAVMADTVGAAQS
jgi:membrane protein